MAEVAIAIEQATVRTAERCDLMEEEITCVSCAQVSFHPLGRSRLLLANKPPATHPVYLSRCALTEYDFEIQNLDLRPGNSNIPAHLPAIDVL